MNEIDRLGLKCALYSFIFTFIAVFAVVYVIERHKGQNYENIDGQNASMCPVCGHSLEDK